MMQFLLAMYFLPVFVCAVMVIAQYKDLGPMLDEQELPGHQERGTYR
jgi:hypothetical protein